MQMNDDAKRRRDEDLMDAYRKRRPAKENQGCIWWTFKILVAGALLFYLIR
jgi:hypothetical protein